MTVPPEIQNDLLSEAEILEIRRFFTSSERNRWFNFTNISVYVRNSRRFISGQGKAVCHYDIASIDVPGHMQHVGVWTLFREVVEKLADETQTPIYIENVLNRRLRESIVRHGYKEANEYSSEVLCYRRMPKT